MPLLHGERKALRPDSHRGILLTRLTDEERRKLAKVHSHKPFVAHNTVKNWTHLTLGLDIIDRILPFVEASYRAALREAGP